LEYVALKEPGLLELNAGTGLRAHELLVQLHVERIDPLDIVEELEAVPEIEVLRLAVICH
jgi:hypothetical protein